MLSKKLKFEIDDRRFMIMNPKRSKIYDHDPKFDDSFSSSLNLN